MDSTEHDEPMTVTQVVGVLGTHRETVLRLLRSGKLRGYKAARNWRVQRSELEKYMDHAQ